MRKRTSGNPFLQALLLFLAIVLAAPAVAQEAGLSTLRGIVTDSTGALVSAVSIKITDPTTGTLVRSLASNSDGAFEVPDLRPGTYKVEASREGFATVVINDVILDAGHIRRLDVKLPVSAVSQTVNVNAGAELIETESGTINAELTSKEIANAPLVFYYPNPFGMFQTLPGVQTYSWNIMVNGMYMDQISQEFDGVESDRYGQQRNNINFYEEASITTMNAPATSARPVDYNLTSKRGTNAFHGSVHYQRMDQAFNAQQGPQVPVAPYLTKLSGKEHDAQVEIGGPIKKDKVFFYSSYYLTRSPASTQEFATVPTPDMMQGNFGALCPAGFNSSGVCLSHATGNLQLYDPTTNMPFPNNVIPSSRISSVSQGLQKFYPSLAQGTTFGNNNYTWVHPYTTGGVFSDYYAGNWLFTRLDYNVSSKNSLYFAGQLRNTPYDWPGGVPTLPVTHVRNEGLISLTDMYTLTPNLINHAVGSVSHDRQVNGLPKKGDLPNGYTEIQSLGLQGVDPSGYNGVGMPAVAFSGNQFNSGTPTGYGGAIGYVDDNATDWSFSDDVTWNKGRHVWTFGETYAYNTNAKDSNSSGTPDYGSYSFNGQYTSGVEQVPGTGTGSSNPAQYQAIPNSGFSYADFLLGAPSYSETSTPLLNRMVSTRVFGAYVSDTYKATPKLTLDYGLRWDYEGLATYRDGLIYNFNPATNQVIVPTGHYSQIDSWYAAAVAPTTVVPGNARPASDKGNWGPRIGVAYRLPYNSVLRGGYGLYWQRFSAFYLSGSQNGNSDGPFLPMAQTYNTPTWSAIAPGTCPGPPLMFPDPYPSSTTPTSPGCAAQAGAAGGQGVNSIGTQRHNGAIHNFNVTLEKEYKKNGFRLSYIGSRSENLAYWVYANSKPANMTPYSYTLLPFPNLSYVWEIKNGGKAHYNSLQFEVKRRQGALTFEASYTLASDLTNMGNVDGNDTYDYLSRWAPNGGDTRNRIVGTVTANLPFGRGQRFLGNASGILNQVVGGWNIESFTYLASGWYFSPYFSGSVDYPNTDTYGGLPDKIPGVKANLAHNKRTYSRFWNTAVLEPCQDAAGCGIGSPNNTPYVYSKLGAFAIPGCPMTSDPLCLNTAQVAVGRYGTAGINSMTGDPLAVTHLGVAKSFPIREKMALHYSLLISDLFNHPHFYNPSGTINSIGVLNPSEYACSGVLNNAYCTSAESVIEGNHAGFRTMAMKVQFNF